MRTRANQDVRQHAKERCVRLWEIGDALGHCNDGVTTRWLRKELDPVDKALVMLIINKIAAREE